MERTIEFRNFEQTSTQISADLYIDGQFIVRFLDSTEHLLKMQKTDVTLYEYFKRASMYFINSNDSCSVECSPQLVATAH
ncbi:MAG: hypothetical protein ACK5WP_03965 [Neisseriaceae bacterium]